MSMGPRHESPEEKLARLREEERQDRRRSDEHLELIAERYAAEKLGLDQGIDGSVLYLREATYQLHDGRHVYYDDGPMGRQTLRDAADLYACLEENHATGSPNLENMQARHILDRLQTGAGLGQVHLNTLVGLLKKHKDAIEALRKASNRDGQDVLDVAPDGPDGGVVDPHALPPKTQEAVALRAESGSFMKHLRESKEGEQMNGELAGTREAADSDLLALAGIQTSELVAVEDTTPAPPAVAPEATRQLRGMSFREAVLMGEMSVLEAVSPDGLKRLREINERNGVTAEVSLLEVLGIDPDHLK
jgi:hypothetical protein